MNKTILILADAFCGAYIDEYEMEFLSRYRQDSVYVPIIHPSFGFCERTEIFTGMRPFNSGNFTAIGYKPDESPYANRDILLSIFKIIEKIDYKNARRALRWYAGKNEIMSPYNIPLQSLKLFKLTEDQYRHEMLNAFIGESIFDILSNERIHFSLEGFTQLGRRSRFSSDDERIQYAIQCMNSDVSFIPIYISVADIQGHIYRDSTIDMKHMAKILDTYLSKIVSDAKVHGYDNIMILGDHGMELVNDTVNIIELLKDNGIRVHRDCEVFLDSTIARFWCNNSKGKKMLRKLLQEKLSKKGFIIDEDNFNAYGIPYNEPFERLYGDLIWCANTGVLIYPDYFNKNMDKGMHGYANPSRYGMGVCICTGNRKVVKEANLFDVCPTLCDMMEIRYPNKNEGRSFVNGE